MLEVSSEQKFWIYLQNAIDESKSKFDQHSGGPPLYRKLCHCYQVNFHFIISWSFQQISLCSFSCFKDVWSKFWTWICGKPIYRMSKKQNRRSQASGMQWNSFGNLPWALSLPRVNKNWVYLFFCYREKMIQAYEFAIEKIGLDYASYPVSKNRWFRSRFASFPLNSVF